MEVLKMLRESRFTIATPPGDTIKEQIEDRGMTQKEFAGRMEMSGKHISRLIQGYVQLTPETARRLESVLGVPAQFWLKLESIYREKLERVVEENARDADVELAKRYPYSAMPHNRWIA